MTEDSSADFSKSEGKTRSSKKTSSKGESVSQTHTSGSHGGSGSHGCSNSSQASSDMDSFLVKINEGFDLKITEALNSFENRFQDMVSAGNYMPTEEHLNDDCGMYEFHDGSKISDLEGLMSQGINTHPSSNERVVDTESSDWQEFAHEFLQDESMGPKVQDGIATMVNTMFSKRMNEDTIAQRLKQYLELVTVRIW